MQRFLPRLLPSRAAALFGLTFVVVIGVIAFASRLSLAQAPADAPAIVAPVPSDAPAAVPSPPEPAPAAAPETMTPAVANPPVPPAKPEAKSAASDPTPAKQLFAAKKLPSLGAAMAIGYYPRGCLQGGVELPINGSHWQVMRLSRNRNWGHPSLVRFVENFADRAAKATGWNGILVGDLAQPRGGPAFSDHMSHQTGLDVDIWFVPMPKETLTPEQREIIVSL